MSFPPGFREKVLRNTVYGIGGRMIGLVVPILLTPYVLHRLDTRLYGLYALASAVTGYLSLLDLGLGAGYVTYVAEAHAKGDHDGVNEVLSTGFYVYLAFGCLLLALWGLVCHRVVRALGVAEPLHTTAVHVFTVAVVVLALSGASAAFRAVLYGLQRIDAATRIGVALILPKVVLVVAVLHLGHGVLGLVLADAALFLLGSGAMAWAARSFFPALSLRPGRVSRASVKKLLGYGTRLQVSRVSEMVNFQLDKILLARYVGLAAVTEYELASKVLSSARSFPLLLVNALVPAVSELEARGSGAGIERVAQRSLRALLLTGAPIFLGIAAVAPRLIDLWLGPGHDGAALAVRVLALGYLLNVASGAFTSVTQGIARNDYQMKLALLGLGLNLILSVTLVFRFGFAGVIVGTGIALVVAYVYADVAFRRLVREALGGSGRWTWRTYLGPALAASAAAAVAVVVGGIVGWPESRLLRGLVLGGTGMAFLGVYLPGLVLFGALDRGDLAMLGEVSRLWGKADKA